MPNPYAQVALTYYRHYRAAGRLWALIGIVYACSALFYVVHPANFVPMIFLLIVAMMCLVFHIKDQFLNTQTSLIPNYRRVHARVAVAAVLVFTVLLPFSLSLLARTGSASLAAFFSIVFSTFLWACLGKRFTALLFPLVFVSFVTDAGRSFYKGFFSGGYELQAYALLLLGLASSVWGLFRLFRVTEDDPAYQALQASGMPRNATAGQNVATVAFLSKNSRDRFLDRHVARLAHHARRAAASRWSRIARWQLGMNAAWFLFVCGLTGFFWIVMYFAYRAKLDSLFMLYLIAGIFPFSTSVALWQAHQPSREILLPVDRATYIRQLGISAASGYFIAWALAWGLSLLLYAARFSAAISGKLLVDLSLISAFSQVPSFAIAVWVARFRSKIWQILALLLPIYLQMALLAAASEFAQGDHARLMVLVAAAAAVVGLLIAYDAYRRWLVADLD